MTERPSPTYIAELTLRARSRDGRSDTVVVAVGAPVQYDELEWQCPVRITGLGRQWTGALSAADSMQSLGMAMSLVARNLRDMVAEGHRLLMPSDADDVDGAEEDWPYDAYFGVFDRHFPREPTQNTE